MTIRRTLLISYLLISLASALLIALMIFAHFRDVLLGEIENKLESQAITIMQQIDTTLFERMQNMASWSHLDVMQEIRTRDVDKRLSQFLYELHAQYEGVYQQLFVINQNEETIAASQATFIGAQYSESLPWLETRLDQHSFRFDPLVSQDTLTISIPITDAFQALPLGRLYAHFNWQEIISLLNGSVSANSAEGIYYTLLVDDQSRIIATSSNLQTIIPAFYLIDKALIQDADSGALNHFARFLEQETLVGYSRSKGYRSYTGLDWRILILQPSDLAFAPVLNVWYVLLLFLFFTLFLGTLVALWMSAKISKPITVLARSTRDFMEGKPTKLRPIKASTEISELNEQFSEMIGSLEQSRLDIARVAKLAVIGEMAASMAHEVRTPLGVLRSSAQILQRESNLSEIGQEMSEFILSETARLNELVTTMLECARPRPPKFSLQNIRLIIEHVRDLLKNTTEEKQVSLNLNTSDLSMNLMCDKDQLIQVFINLIMNAIQHVSKAGHIDIHLQWKADMIEIMVCDNGSGISDSQKQAVFDPFYTARKEGVGLGLTIVQQIVLTHQGQIFISDNRNGGSCFHIHLPIDQRENN